MSKTKDDGATALAGCVVAILTMLFLLCGGLLIGEYSSGHRDGHIQKLSHKGIIWKTWEGQLTLAGLHLRQGDGGNSWHFSIVDEAVASQLENLAEDVPVRLYYKQYLYPAPAMRGTSYVVWKVEKLAPAGNKALEGHRD